MDSLLSILMNPETGFFPGREHYVVTDKKPVSLVLDFGQIQKNGQKLGF